MQTKNWKVIDKTSTSTGERSAVLFPLDRAVRALINYNQRHLSNAARTPDPSPRSGPNVEYARDRVAR